MITFFGERSPPAVSKFVKEDMQRCDLIVVMGTSLKVGGAVVELLGHARKEVVSHRHRSMALGIYKSSALILIHSFMWHVYICIHLYFDSLRC